jgi:UDP-3-O-[3-hydroxymyristoyl] glucosamine N-acyltransferase
VLSVAELARALDAEAEGDVALTVTGPAEPASAGRDQLAVAMEPRYAAALGQGQARVALLWPGADWRALGLAAAIFVRRPRYALAGLGRAFERVVRREPGIHATAIVDPSARLGTGASVGAYVVIGPGAVIGDRARILPHVTVAEDTAIGDDALLHAGARIGARVRIGHRFIAQPGAVIGGDGFSFVTPTPGIVEEARLGGDLAAFDAQEYVRINSLGSVLIGDDVEVGANACIDRGTIADTAIGDGTKIDNHVQIGHNVRVGRTCLICGHVAIGGSTVVEDRVVLGGKAAIADHLTIGANSVITGHSGVASNVPPNRVMMGYPAVQMHHNVEMYKALRRLPRLIAKLEAAEKRAPRTTQSD